jgi:DNA-binding beta-propeller fold protein YncE
MSGEEVFVTDYENDRVQVFGLDGSYKRQWGGEGDGAGQFNYPADIAVSEGEVFVVSVHRIQVSR